MFIIEWMFDKIGYEKKSSFAWTFPAPKTPDNSLDGDQTFRAAHNVLLAEQLLPIALVVLLILFILSYLQQLYRCINDY